MCHHFLPVCNTSPSRRLYELKIKCIPLLSRQDSAHISFPHPLSCTIWSLVQDIPTSKRSTPSDSSGFNTHTHSGTQCTLHSTNANLPACSLGHLHTSAAICSLTTRTFQVVSCISPRCHLIFLRILRIKRYFQEKSLQNNFEDQNQRKISES